LLYEEEYHVFGTQTGTVCHGMIVDDRKMLYTDCKIHDCFVCTVLPLHQSCWQLLCIIKTCEKKFDSHTHVGG